MAEIVISDRRRQPARFDGELVSMVTTERDGSWRWAEFRVYELEAGGWLLHRTGMSNVYHTEPTTCRTASGRPPGDPATISDLPDNAVPCVDCLPPLPLDLGDTEKIRFEFPRNTWNQCPTADRVVDSLTRFRERGTGTWTVKISEPVAELLDDLAAAREAFANVTRPVPTV